MDKVLFDSSSATPTSNGHETTNGTNGVNGKASSEEKPKSLVDAAKSAAVEVTNGIKNLAVSN